jgi:hypothetical protein
MTEAHNDSLKKSTFDTWAGTETKGAAIKTVQVKVDHRAATRQAIIVALRREGCTFATRSEWKALPGKNSDGPDWDYKGIALHHAGNSFSCDVDGAAQLRKAEQIDLKSFGHLSYHYAIACDGTIYEALDIREKGAHIAAGNTGVIGIVMLADLSVHGEAYQEEYAGKSLFGRIKGMLNWVPDQLDTVTDEPPEQQLKALFTLVDVLHRFFPVTTLGGHREFQQLATGDGRACPGAHGMILVDMLRRKHKLAAPGK